MAMTKKLKIKNEKLKCKMKNTTCKMEHDFGSGHQIDSWQNRKRMQVNKYSDWLDLFNKIFIFMIILRAFVQVAFTSSNIYISIGLRNYVTP
jgi:hypothetical protein